MIRFSMPVTQEVSMLLRTTLDLQLSSLCYNSNAHYSLMQCLRTRSAIPAGANSYFVVSSFKCEEKNSCHDFIPIFYILYIIYYNFQILREILFLLETEILNPSSGCFPYHLTLPQ